MYLVVVYGGPPNTHLTTSFVKALKEKPEDFDLSFVPHITDGVRALFMGLIGLWNQNLEHTHVICIRHDVSVEFDKKTMGVISRVTGLSSAAAPLAGNDQAYLTRALKSIHGVDILANPQYFNRYADSPQTMGLSPRNMSMLAQTSTLLYQDMLVANRSILETLMASVGISEKTKVDPGKAISLFFGEYLGVSGLEGLLRRLLIAQETGRHLSIMHSVSLSRVEDHFRVVATGDMRTYCGRPDFDELDRLDTINEESEEESEDYESESEDDESEDDCECEDCPSACEDCPCEERPTVDLADLGIPDK